MTETRIGFHIPLMKSPFQSIKYHFEKSGIREYQLFVKNPKGFGIKILDEEESRRCKDYIRDNGIFLVNHASYVLNMANRDKWEIKVNCGKNELDLAEQIGSSGVVFHVGKHLKLSVSDGEDLMYEYILEMIQHVQSRGYRVKFVLETSAHCGTELCWRIEDLGRMFNRFTPEQKENLAICVDTCHVFSSGYRLSSESGCVEFINLVETHIGWNNVAVIHLNDSAGLGGLNGCGCKADRHANIMKGFIQDGMKTLIKHTTERGIPHILETPLESEDKIFETHMEEIDIVKNWVME